MTTQAAPVSVTSPDRSREASRATTALLADACARAARYLRDIQTRRVFPDDKDIAALAQLREPLPEAGQHPARIIATLDDLGSPATVAQNAGRYFGFVNGAAFPVCVAAQSLVAAWDQNTALRIMSPAAAAFEDVALGWLVELFGFPKECAAAFVSGATTANFTGLAAARHALLARAGWDVESDGLFRAPELNVIAGEEAHVSVLKAVALLGLGKSRVTLVPTDSQGRMRAERLPKLDARTIVILQAGNVNTGGFDPIREICEMAAGSNAGVNRAWVHIDGAFGLWARVDPAHAALVDGLERADSWGTDGHKWLNLPYDCGIAFVRDAASLRAAMSAPAAYLLTDGAREPSNHNPESSQRARGVAAWAALKFLGRAGVRDLVRGCCDRAQQFAVALRAAGFSVLNDAVLNQVIVSFGDAETTNRVIRRVQKDGTCWCGATVWRGQTAMRISVSSWMTTPEDVDRSVAAIISAAR